MTKDDSKNPPQVPDGWVAKFDDEYSTWYYVDLKTKKSQWDAPAGTRFDSKSAGDDVPPPAYSPTESKSRSNAPSGNQPRPAASNPNTQRDYQQGPPQGQYYQQQQQQQPQKQSRFGGGAGSMALGVGGGLLGGMLLGNAINSWEDHERMEGYQDGYQDGYDNGGDYDGGDFGGGDF